MLELLSQTRSTNVELAERLRSGALVPEGHWLIADRQTSGRGRLGREWHDGMGNFMGSTVVHRRFGDPGVATLALVAGLAVLEVVTQLVPAAHPPMLKWPNDVLIGGAKLAGILMEREGDSIVIGIGVNLCSAPDLPDRRAVSLADFDSHVTRDAFAGLLARQFDLELDRWRSFGLEVIITRWLAAAHPLGTAMTVSVEGSAPLTGTFAGLTGDGALQLRTAGGTTQTVNAGEIILAAKANHASSD